MGIFRFDDRRPDHRLRGEAEPGAAGGNGSSTPRGSASGGTTAEKPFVASMGIYVFSREVLLEILEPAGIDFGKEIIPRRSARDNVTLHLSAATGPTSAPSRRSTTPTSS